MPNGRSADVVVVGGGIIGCFIAYYLTRRGVKPLVIEASGIGSQASGRAAGIITPSWGPVPAGLMKLHPATFRMHVDLAARLPEESGVDYGYELIPHVKLVFTEDGAANLRKWQAERLAEGSSVTWLTPEEARNAVPYLTGEPLGGVVSEIEPQCDAFELVRAVARAARRGGAQFMAGRFAGLSRDGDRATGVTVQDGSQVSAGLIVLAMGPWTGETSRLLEFPVPVAPQRGQLFTLSEGSDPTAGAKVGVWAWDVGGFILPKRIGGTIIGTTREDGVGFDRSVTVRGRQNVIAGAARLNETITEASIVGERACLRPVTPDGNPLVGPVPGWRGVVMASGHGGNGIHFGPVTGTAVADLLIDGRTGYDLAPFAPGRFVSGGAKAAGKTRV